MYNMNKCSNIFTLPPCAIRFTLFNVNLLWACLMWAIIGCQGEGEWGGFWYLHVDTIGNRVRINIKINIRKAWNKNEGECSAGEGNIFPPCQQGGCPQIRRLIEILPFQAFPLLRGVVLADGFGITHFDIPRIEPGENLLVVVGLLQFVLGRGPAAALNRVGNPPVGRMRALSRGRVSGADGAAFF